MRMKPSVIFITFQGNQNYIGLFRLKFDKARPNCKPFYFSKISLIFLFRKDFSSRVWRRVNKRLNDLNNNEEVMDLTLDEEEKSNSDKDEIMRMEEKLGLDLSDSEEDEKIERYSNIITFIFEFFNPWVRPAFPNSLDVCNL